MSDGPKESPLPPQEDLDALDLEMKQKYEEKFSPDKVPDEEVRSEFVAEAIDGTWAATDIIHSAESRKLIDPLTGLQNREGLKLALARIYQNAENNPGTEVHAFMLDLDHFKKVNDTHGHKTGDEVIIALSGVLRKATDTAFRMGGEEFLIVTSNPPPTFEDQHVQPLDPNVFINKIRVRIARNVASQTVIQDQGVSAGFAKLEVDPKTRKFITQDELIRRADVALYHAKTTGRRRAIAYKPNMTMPQKGK